MPVKSFCCKSSAYEQAKLVKCFQFNYFLLKREKKKKKKKTLPSMHFVISSVYYYYYFFFLYSFLKNPASGLRRDVITRFVEEPESFSGGHM